MEWKLELYRAFFVAFGAMEILTNARYLIKKDGVNAARKQHQELPKNVTDLQMKRKVICMFLFGGLFLVNGLVSYYARGVNELAYMVALSLLGLYALMESMYYKYWKTFGFLALTVVVAILFYM